MTQYKFTAITYNNLENIIETKLTPQLNDTSYDVVFFSSPFFGYKYDGRVYWIRDINKWRWNDDRTFAVARDDAGNIYMQDITDAS
ncbi:MAG: hypothetical protein CMF19_09350 [Idiomarinaceae bacterium]|nr:hypothetical protein [Idiomarinaceae bacterium]